MFAAVVETEGVAIKTSWRAPKVDLRVCVIGAGFGGIAAGVRLKRLGIEQFTIFERGDGVGGTWWQNTYPGAEVDTASDIYSYSFKPHNWTRTHARQPEVQAYLQETVEEYGLSRHLQLKTSVTAATWDEDRGCYSVRTSASDEALEFDVVVSAVGLLSEPRHPTWPGLDEFRGAKFHTALWDHACDLAGKRVAVVGTGSTGAQVVADIAPVVGHLALFQREPGWVLPKADRDFTPEDVRARATAWGRRVRRMKAFWRVERPQIGARSARSGTKANKLGEDTCRQHIARVFEDRPDLEKLVTPDYPFFGKRPVVSNDFYPALLRDNVELVPRAVVEITPHGVVDSDGVERSVDVLVMATGFQPADFLSSLTVVGRDGRSLAEVWGGEPAALAGLAVPLFPNFFMLYGPNTNGGLTVFNIERQTEVVVRCLRRLHRGAWAIEARPRVTDVYNRWLQRRLAGTAWATESNYYKSSTGKVVTNWCDGSILYGLLTKTLGRTGFRTMGHGRLSR